MAGDTFQKLKSSINRGVTAINIKASSSLEKVKIKTHIESIKSDIEKLTAAAGQCAYTVWENGETDYSVLEEQFVLIKEKKAEIAQLEEEYNSIDDRDNKILGNTASEEPAAEVQGSELFSITCPGCGSTYTTPVRFCRKCGCKLSD